jgi:ATP synthase protein I
MALVAGLLGGMHAAVSALLGGIISVVAGWVFAVIGDGGAAKSGGVALLGMLRAEAAKVGLMVLLLWLVLTLYRDVVVPGLIASFVATVLIFAMAIFVRES